MEVLKTHPCMRKEGVLEGFICPFCFKVFSKIELAILCKESHDELEVDYVFTAGNRFPVEVIVKRMKGTEMVEVATYKIEKVEKIDKGKVVKENKEK